MGEYVDRYALNDELAKLLPYVIADSVSAAYTQGLNAAHNALLDFPAADVVPVRHGAWKKIKIPPAGYNLHGYLCSFCGFLDEGVHSMTGKPFAYCPNCGARMDA